MLLWAGLLPLLVARVQEAGSEEETDLQALAARCGEELRWAKDWPEAAQRAEVERKPVLAIAWFYPGFQLTDGVRTVFAMDPDVIELVNERFVPLRLELGMDVPFAAQESYGISGTAFGSALLVVAPDGRVLADCPFLLPTLAYDFLVSALAKHPEYPGALVPEDLPPEERVLRLAARGEFAEALELLDPRDGGLPHARSASALLCRARIHRLTRKPGRWARLMGASWEQDALRTLKAAYSCEPGLLLSALELEEIELHIQSGRMAEARAACEHLVQEHPTSAEARAAAYLLGSLDFHVGKPAEAEARWRALAREHPESRWAWLAAATLLTPRAELELGLRLAGPEEDLRESLRESPWTPLPSSLAEAAAHAGLIRLLETQREGGTWPDPSELEGDPELPNAVSAAIDALAARALLAHRERSDCRRAAERAHRALLAARASAEPATGPAYMVYEVWSLSVWLELLADLREARLIDEEELRTLGAELARELLGLQRSNGGWSYFQSVSLDEDAPKLEQSISFVTASVVLALIRAHGAGIEVDEEALQRALDCLEAMRGENGTFAYMLWPGQGGGTGEAQVAGAAGRSPVCELALLRGGRSDLARLRGALELFFRHASTLAKERGKALMHAGAEGQGCHYVLYDYATAAQAIAELPEEERLPCRERLLELVLETRRLGGSFLDAPILGTTSSTALALLAVRALDAARGGK